MGKNVTKNQSIDNNAFMLLLLGAFFIGFSPIIMRYSDLGPIATAFHRIFLMLPLGYLMVVYEFNKLKKTRAEKSSSKEKNITEHNPIIQTDLSLNEFIKSSLRNKKAVKYICLSGFFFSGDLFFWHLSVNYTTISNSTLFANMAPIVVAFISFFIFKIRFKPIFLLGLVMAISGAIMLVFGKFELNPQNLLGDIFGLITAIFYGAYIVTISEARRFVNASLVIFFSSLITGLFLLIATFIVGESILITSLYSLGILLLLSWVTHFGGQGLIVYALAHIPSTLSSVSLLLQPIIATIMAYLFFGEALSFIQIIGMLCVLTAIQLARMGSK